MAAKGSLTNPDKIICPICLETIREPKLLPCIHTFCLRCLQTLCDDNDPGDEVPCPVCRQLFVVPDEGVKDLTTNFFMIQLLQVNQSEISNAGPAEGTTLCEVCSELDVETVSTSYCVECTQHFCDKCSLIHRKQKATKSHQVVDGKDKPSSKERAKMAVSYCQQHPDKPIALYCCDCKTDICQACYVKSHNKHKCADVKEAAEKLHFEQPKTKDV